MPQVTVFPLSTEISRILSEPRFVLRGSPRRLRSTRVGAIRPRFATTTGSTRRRSRSDSRDILITSWQDHRAVKWITRPMLGFKSLWAASGSSLACPPLPQHHLKPGSLAPNLGDHGPSDSALAASSVWRLRRPAADRHAARCASRDLCSGARHSAPCALSWDCSNCRACC
jgi:hypothetical protein